MPKKNQIRWFIGSADEAAAARNWLRDNAPEGSWQFELLGLEDVPGLPRSRIAVRCTFADEICARSFAEGFLRSGRTAPAVPPPTPPETDADAAFAAGARQILEGPQPISAGKLHFLGLDHVRERIGDQWPKLTSRAEALIRRAIERRLTPQDVYRKTGDLNFVVMFANLSGREADLKCAVIAEEIGRMLVGDEFGAGMLAVKSVATDIDGPATLGKLGSTEDIAQAIEAEVEAERLRREPSRAGAAAPDAVAAAGVDPLANIRFMYRPFWDVHRSALANYSLILGRVAPGGQWRPGISDIASLGTPEIQKRLDTLVMERAISDLAALSRQNRRLVISVPIHFESISTVARRGEIIARWRSLPLEVRRLAVFEIVGAPEGIPQSRVAEITNHLRMETRGVLARVALETRAFRNFSDTGILAVGTDISGVLSSEERIIQSLREFVAHAEKARLVGYVRGLRTFSLTIAAIGAGFAFVDGEPLSGISELPDNAYRFELEDLYTKRLRPSD